MITTLAGAAAISAAGAIAAEWNGQEHRHRSFYLLKPLTTLLIFALAAVTTAHTPPDYRLWVLIALLFCAAGDICLMFTGQRWFLGGLSNFLIGHALFIAALVQGLTRFSPPWWSLAWVAFALPVAFVVLPRTGALKIPVLIYMAVIGAMVSAALIRFDALADRSSLLALVGATLFMLSDSSLAVRQFIAPYRLAQPLILSTYWLAVGLIACSV